MSTFQLFGLVLLIFMILFVILPAMFYMITKSIYDAKFKSIYDNTKTRKETSNGKEKLNERESKEKG